MLSMIWGLILGGFLIAHGLLHWRFDISQSWLLKGIGVPVLHDSWRSLAILSSVVSLLRLVLAWHPWLSLRFFLQLKISSLS